MLVVIYANHYEIIALYEASKECVWLSFVMSHIQKICNMPPIINSPTIVYKDNVVCVVQVKE